MSNSCQSGVDSSTFEICARFFGGGSHNFDSADIALVVFDAIRKLWKYEQKTGSVCIFGYMYKIYLEIMKDSFYRYIDWYASPYPQEIILLDNQIADRDMLYVSEISLY